MSDHPVFGKREKIESTVDIIRGLISLANGDLQGIKPLAQQIGGFPTDLDVLQKFVDLIRANKSGISYKSIQSQLTVSNAASLV